MQKIKDNIIKSNPLEVILGLIVLGTAIFFTLIWIYSVSEIKSISNNTYFVEFSDVSGLLVDSEVKVGGLKVGNVDDIEIDDNLSILVTLAIRKDINFPHDSVVTILNSGLSGGKFIDIIPGSSEIIIKSRGKFEKSQDVQSIEDIISRALFLVQNQTIKE